MESLDYSQLENEINKNVPRENLADLNALSAYSEYDKSKSSIENMEELLKNSAYSNNPEVDGSKMAHRHSYLLARLVHEQCLASGMKEGFNEFKNILDQHCAAFELKNGKLAFFDGDRNLLGQFDIEKRFTILPDAALSKQKARMRKLEITQRTSKSLQELLPEFTEKITPPNLPQIKTKPFKLPPSVFRETETPPLLLDLDVSTGDMICAGYVIEFVRYYLGSKWIWKHRLENKDAWEMRDLLLSSDPPAISVSASMNSTLEPYGDKFAVTQTVENDGELKKLYGDEAKATGSYQNSFRTFLDKAASQPGYPPGLISLYYNGTARNADIIAANKSGNDAHNSHITVNLGEGKKSLDFGEVPEPTEYNPDRKRNVMEVVLENFPKAKEQFGWMIQKNAGTEASRVYMNGQQLLYRDGELYVKDGNGEEFVATASPLDKIEWEDVFVADRFHAKNRVNGLCELMMTGKYELVDVMQWEPEALPKEVKESEPKMPFAVAGIIHLKKGQTLEDALIAHGIKVKDLPLHMYAYDIAGLKPSSLRPLDAIPVFDKKSLESEIKKYGGLSDAIAQRKAQQAEIYNKAHPDRRVFVITHGLTPDRLAQQILQMPQLEELGKLSGQEKQFILRTVFSANPHISLDINVHGTVVGAPQYLTADILYVTDKLLSAAAARVQKTRFENEVYIPSELPGGETLKPVEFTAKERKIIEASSTDPDVRRSLALILAMEQKQVSREWNSLWIQRGEIKQIAHKVGMTHSFGMFQIRPMEKDITWWAKQKLEYANMEKKDAAEIYEEILENNPEENARLAARRVDGILSHAADIYEAHREEFSGKMPGCIAFTLNVYHSAESKTLMNIFSVWGAFLEEALGIPLDKEKTAATEVAGRFKKIAETARQRGLLEINDAEIENGTELIMKNKTEFLKSGFLDALEKFYIKVSGKKLSLNIPPEVYDRTDIDTTHLSYGIRASRYGALETIRKHSDKMRETKKERTA